VYGRPAPPPRPKPSLRCAKKWAGPLRNFLSIAMGSVGPPPGPASSPIAGRIAPGGPGNGSSPLGPGQLKAHSSLGGSDLGGPGRATGLVPVTGSVRAPPLQGNRDRGGKPRKCRARLFPDNVPPQLAENFWDRSHPRRPVFQGHRNALFPGPSPAVPAAVQVFRPLRSGPRSGPLVRPCLESSGDSRVHRKYSFPTGRKLPGAGDHCGGDPPAYAVDPGNFPPGR